MFGEAHAHVFMDGVNYRAAAALHRKGPDEAAVRAHLAEYQKRGITYVRDGGDHYGSSVLARELAPEYGITYRTPVFGIHLKGAYGAIVGRSFSDLREYRELIKRASEAKADFIKIMTTGILDFDGRGQITGEPLPGSLVKEMVHIAHEEGFSVMSHTNGAKNARIAIEAGVDSLEHGNYLDEQAVQALAESDTVWVPTAVTVRNLLGDGRYDDGLIRSICRSTEESLRLAYGLQAKVALGSDAGAYRVLHGQGLLDEYAAFGEILGKDPSLDAWLQSGDRQIRSRFCRL